MKLPSSEVAISSDSESTEPGRSKPTDPDEELDEGDVSLIHWMLEMSPTERLEMAQDFLEGALALRNGRRVPG